MTKSELERYRNLLLGLGRRLKGEVSSLQTEAFRTTGGASSGNLSNTPMHMADLGTDAFEQEVAASLLETEELKLEEIAEALARIDQGTFGRCEECHKEIAKERLQALPSTRHCIQCARRLQDEEQAQPPTNL